METCLYENEALNSAFSDEDFSGLLAKPAKVSPLFSKPQALHSFTDQQLRVLLIEDDQDTRDMMQATLEWLGYAVLTARDGEAGLKLVESERPDVFISDIRMPGLDGYGLIAQIRMNPAIACIPGIALTGLGMKSDFQQAIAAGFDAHVIKPADIAMLSGLLRRLAVEGHHPQNPPS